MIRRYLNKRDRLLLKVCNDLYKGDSDVLIKDFEERLYSKPMYLKLERRLREDIERLEKLRLYSEIDEFIREKILCK